MEWIKKVVGVAAHFGISVPDGAEIVVGADAHHVIPGYVFPVKTLQKLSFWIIGDTVLDVTDNGALPASAPGFQNVAIVGDAGVGKTSLLRETAARFGFDFESISVSGETRYESLFGRREIVGGNTVYVEAGLARMYRNGGVFCANEFWRMDPGEQMRLVDMLDVGGHLTNPETGDRIPRHPLFRFCVTGNSSGFGDETGAYAGERPGSLAIRDRFLMLSIESMSEDAEEAFLKTAVPGLAGFDDTVKLMVSVARQARKNFVGNGGAIPVDISLRGLERWGNAMVAYSNIKRIEKPLLESLEDSILNGCPAEVKSTFVELVNEWHKK